MPPPEEPNHIFRYQCKTWELDANTHGELSTLLSLSIDDPDDARANLLSFYLRSLIAVNAARTESRPRLNLGPDPEALKDQSIDSWKDALLNYRYLLEQCLRDKGM